MDTNFWRAMLNALPITVLINPAGRYYNVRNASELFIWSDDLPDDGIDGLARNIAYAVAPDNEPWVGRALSDWLLAALPPAEPRVFTVRHMDCAMQIYQTMLPQGVLQIRIEKYKIESGKMGDQDAR